MKTYELEMKVLNNFTKEQVLKIQSEDFKNSEDYHKVIVLKAAIETMYEYICQHLEGAK